MTDAPRALLVDYGGVLTPPLGQAFRTFETSHEMPEGTIFGVLASAYKDGADDGSIARVERGELTTAEFQQQLADGFQMFGFDVTPESVLRDLFADFRPDGPLWDVVGAAREAGVRTVLLSNSWGVDDYPRDRLAEVFDDLVISGEVGLRKPDPAIYELAAEKAGVPLEACVFIDDLSTNVDVANELGMTGVLHATDARATTVAVGEALGLDLTHVLPGA